jgi:beta-phosphoglucomutase-like phosphatase (HAD superfamily)
MRRSCASEESKLRSTSIRIFRARGDRNPEAEADRMLRDGYRNEVEGYRKLPGIERQLEALKPLIAYCKAHPQECKD